MHNWQIEVDQQVSTTDNKDKTNYKEKQVSSSSSPLKALLKEYMQKNDALVRTEASSIRILELQMGQIAEELKNRQRGSLASNTEAPRNAGNSNKE